MADLGTAYVKIAPNMQGIQGKIAAGFKGAAADATKKLGDEVDSNSGPFQKAIGKLGGIAKTGGIAIATGIGAGIAGLTALTGKALGAGAELEQQLGGAEAVFGKYADGIKEAATTAYFEAGLSQNEFLQGANKMGSLFQGAGFDVQTSMKMSADSMQRASDIASIIGISTTAALEAVTGMAKGNFTMMDNLGVAMNDTAIGAYALSKGIKKTTAEMSIQEKVGLAQQMFMEKTAKYAGNYAKENQTLAGSLNSTRKAFQDLLTGNGDVGGFMELLVNTIELAIPRIVEILPKIVSAVGVVLKGLVPALSQAIPVLLPALINAVTGLLTALVDAMPGIVKVLLAGLPALINAFIKIFLGILKALPQIIKVLAEAMPEIIDALVDGLTAPDSLTAIILAGVELFLAILQAIPIVVIALVKAVPEIVTNIVSALTSGTMLSAMRSAGTKLFAPIVEVFPKIVAALGTVKDAIMGLITTGLNALNTALQATIGWLRENQVWLTNTGIIIGTLLLPKIIALGIEAVKAAASWTLAAAQTALAWAKTIPGMIAGFAQAAAASAVNAAKVLASWVVSAVQTLASWAVTFASYLAGIAVAAAQTLIAGARMAAGWLLALGPIGLIIAAVAGATALIIANWDKVKGAFIAVWNFITGLWSQATSFFSNVGKNLVQGLWNGINDMTGWIISKIKGFGESILKGIKSFFGIHSPSTVFAGIGTDLNRGLAKGIDKSTGLVSSAVTDMSNQALSAMVSPEIAATYTTAGTAAATGGGTEGGTLTQNTFTGAIVLADATAVQEFFKSLNQDTIAAMMGVTPVQGAA